MSFSTKQCPNVSKMRWVFSSIRRKSPNASECYFMKLTSFFTFPAHVSGLKSITWIVQLFPLFPQWKPPKPLFLASHRCCCCDCPPWNSHGNHEILGLHESSLEALVRKTWKYSWKANRWATEKATGCGCNAQAWCSYCSKWASRLQQQSMKVPGVLWMTSKRFTLWTCTGVGNSVSKPL